MAVRLTPGITHRYSRRRGHGRMSDINVTPLVDVMLVLLIVFMVTAPLLTAGVDVDLPQSAAPPLTQPQEPLVVSIDKAGKIFIQETEVPLASLGPRLSAITESKPDTSNYMRGYQTINDGRVMEVMGLLTASGFTKVALVTESKGEAPAEGSQSN